MASTEVEAPRQLLDVVSGVLLPATPSNAYAVIKAARERKQLLDEVIRDANAWLAEESKRLGTKTFQTDHGKLSLTGGPETQYDAHALEEGLRAAGCPDGRIRDVVVEEISYKVDRRILKQLTAANPAYLAAAEAAKIVIDKPYRTDTK